MIRVAVDALGGDKAPEEIVAGALDAASDGITPILFGPQGLETHGLELVETTEVVGMHDKPADVVRTKPDSSLVRAVRAVAEGEADVILSAGNTGAVLAAGLLQLRRLPGVMRPAIAVPIPTRTRPVRPARRGRECGRAPGASRSSSPTWAPCSPRRSSGCPGPR